MKFLPKNLKPLSFTPHKHLYSDQIAKIVKSIQQDAYPPLPKQESQFFY